MKYLKQYKWVILVVAVDIIIAAANPASGALVAENTWDNFRQMLAVIPPIFILLGLLDVWVPRETIVKFMGDNSGVVGIFLSIFLGAAAAGPLYGAFPVAVMMIKKGAKFSNVITFLGAWSTLKIPMFLFEMSAMGHAFAVSRWLINIPGIIIMGFLVDWIMKREEKETLFQAVQRNF
ncbi:permease [Metallumcola ferriviriculae]|uniref:Permease n=1 Tax=Metallumcola ferriviriculae TaxID=3039180 RepID=A0AAU0ULG9_9FIRM|nr:permease [Desulfitibacteraceae bacterium MK1]